MHIETIIFFAILLLFFSAVIYLLVQLWRKATNRWLKIVPLFFVLLAVFVYLMFHAGYTLNQSRMYYVVFGLALASLVAVALFLVFSKQTRLAGKIVSGSAAAVVAGAAVSAFWFIHTNDMGYRSLYREHLTDDLYLHIEMSDYYPVPLAFVKTEKFGFITASRFASGDCPYEHEKPDSVSFTSFRDSILVFTIWEEGLRYPARIDMRFDQVDELREGLSLVWKDNRRGAIDSTGKIVIPVEYTMLGDCHNGLMMAQKDGGQVGFINPANELVIPFRFDYAGHFLSDSACVKLNGRRFYIDKNGKRLSDY